MTARPAADLAEEIAEIGLAPGPVEVEPLTHNATNTITDAIDRVRGAGW